MDIHKKTVAEIASDLECGLYSSHEITETLLKRIDTQNPSLNAFISITGEHALAQAKAADQQRAAGHAGPLTGVPFAHKDLFCTQGVKTSCGSKMLDNFISPYDAGVVSKMQSAGMVMLGKLNMDEFAMGSSNETSYYGPVHNPWDNERVPGGSSGGSAAAVAACLVPAATGTDTGGSIRQPAALCGITGLKPTYGRVSRYGMIAFASSLDQGGPLARSAEDCALLLNVMAGFDERDSTSVDTPVPDYTDGLQNSLKGLKIGLPKAFFNAQLSTRIGSVLNAAIEQYKQLGAELIDIDLPHLHLSVPTYYIVAPAECSSNLSRFDGVRFGHRCDSPSDITDLYKRSRGEGFGAEVKRRIMVGTYALSAGYYDAYYVKAQKVRQLIAEDFNQAFEKVDLILGPTTPEVAFKLGEKAADPLSMYLSDVYTIAVNLAGLPAISIPAGFIEQLPVGLQLIGSYFNEAKLLNAAHQFQHVTDWHLRTPTIAK